MGNELQHEVFWRNCFKAAQKASLLKTKYLFQRDSMCWFGFSFSFLSTA